jgi:small subunit ribosomal protein S10
MPGDRIRIKLKGYDHRLVDEASKSIVETARDTGAKVAGPIPLPTKIKRWCVIRSPFIDKTSMEHFEMRVHKRLIDIIEPSPKIVDALMQLELPSGVDIEISL